MSDLFIPGTKEIPKIKPREVIEQDVQIPNSPVNQPLQDNSGPVENPPVVDLPPDE